jgi:hypothetical protein
MTDVMKRCKQAKLVLTSMSVGENISKEGMLNASLPTRLLIHSWASYNRTTGPSHLDKSWWRKFRPRAILLHVCSRRRGYRTLLCVAGIYSWPNLENCTTNAHVHFMLSDQDISFHEQLKVNSNTQDNGSLCDWLTGSLPDLYTDPLAQDNRYSNCSKNPYCTESHKIRSTNFPTVRFSNAFSATLNMRRDTFYEVFKQTFERIYFLPKRNLHKRPVASLIWHTA